MSDWTGMGPNAPAPKLDSNCQCICHSQPGVMHVAACCSAPPMTAARDDLAARGVRVRPLRWWTNEEAPSLYVAGNPFAEYRVNKAIVSGLFYVRFNLLKGGFDDYYPTLEAAKAAAEADYEDRILAALEVTP